MSRVPDWWKSDDAGKEVVMRESYWWFSSEEECKKDAKKHLDFDYPDCWGLRLRIESRDV